MRVMRRILRSLPLPLVLAVSPVGACATHTSPPPAAPAAAAESATPAAKPTGALAALEPLLGDWKHEGGEVHYVFAGDAVFGVAFTGESYEVSIVTAEPTVKTRVYKDGASEVVSDAAPTNEGLTRIESPRVPAIEQSEKDFAEASAARGASGWADWFDDKGGQWDGGADGAEGKRIEGKVAVKEYMTPVLSRPGYRLEWRPITSALAPGGALGYTVGTWEGVVISDGGKRDVKRHGAFVTVWKRQGDGSWWVLFDTGDPAS
jgi:hypothetical protein